MNNLFDGVPKPWTVNNLFYSFYLLDSGARFLGGLVQS